MNISLSLAVVLLSIATIINGEKVNKLREENDRIYESLQKTKQSCTDQILAATDKLEERIATLEHDLDSIQFLMGKVR